MAARCGKFRLKSRIARHASMLIVVWGSDLCVDTTVGCCMIVSRLIDRLIRLRIRLL